MTNNVVIHPCPLKHPDFFPLRTKDILMTPFICLMKVYRAQDAARFVHWLAHYLLKNILQNILFYVPQMKLSHMIMEGNEGE